MLLIAEELEALMALEPRDRARQLKEKNFIMEDLSGRNICLICQASFASTYTVTRHIAAVHIAMNIYPCDICSLSYSTKSQLYTHVKRKHPPNE